MLSKNVTLLFVMMLFSTIHFYVMNKVYLNLYNKNLNLIWATETTWQVLFSLFRLLREHQLKERICSRFVSRTFKLELALPNF